MPHLEPVYASDKNYIRRDGDALRQRKQNRRCLKRLQGQEHFLKLMYLRVVEN
jgi:hypothetical protein